MHRHVHKRSLLGLVIASILFATGCGGCSGSGTGGTINVAPQINCASISTPLQVGQSYDINCDVSDDGNPSNTLTLSWVIQQAPAGVTSLDVSPTGSITYAPPVAGSYVLRLSADDGEAVSHADVSFIAVSTPFEGTVKVLPLGDSITQGNDVLQSYRYRLWQKLIDSGIDFDFVGSQNSNNGGNPVFPDYNGNSFDLDHEGHWGETAHYILNLLPGWLSSYDADVALVHLGTNDSISGETADSTISELEQIIDALRLDNPDITVLMAVPIPALTGFFPEILAELQEAIPGLVQRKDTVKSRVILVDQDQGFDPSTDLADSFHPNEAGEEKMATKWFEAINALLGN